MILSVNEQIMTRGRLDTWRADNVSLNQTLFAQNQDLSCKTCQSGKKLAVPFKLVLSL